MRLGVALIAAGLGAGALGGVWLHGRHQGVLACEADRMRAQRAAETRLHATAEALSRRAYALRQAQDALSARAREHEDALRADPYSCRRPDPVSLRRLRTRWGADPAPAG